MLFSGKIEEANLSCRNLFCNKNINESRLYISLGDISISHWNAGMQFGGHNYFLSWSG
jgi:hypothetical protein